MSSPRGLTWYFWSVVHNCIIHPVLPIADFLAGQFGPNFFSLYIFYLHDNTYPEGGG